MNSKEKYREFCEKEKEIPIFSKYWWLDAVCGKENWNVLLFEKNSEILASMPYYTRKKVFFDLILMPVLTQTMGVYIKYPKGQKYNKKMSWEKEAMNSLIKQLPKCDYFTQNFSNKFLNWLPFFWEGFNQTTRYTYVIDGLNMDQVEKGFDNDIRRRRKKAIEIGVEICEDENIEIFYRLNCKTFERQGMKTPYSLSFIKKFYETCKSYSSVKVFYAKYEDKYIASSFLVFDHNTVYYLMGGVDMELKNLGGMDMVLYESIKFSIENSKVFDFEGSMVESIEKYFRSYGAVQKPYNQITKISSKLLKVRDSLMN